MAGSESHRVLVVDDDRDSAELTALVLGGAGLQVAKVHSGQEALEAIHLLSPHLVLLDINMDAMDGWETLTLLRADESTRDLPVAMFSVRFDLREKLQGIQLGATDYITKPFVNDDLIRRVHRLLEGPRG